MSPSFNVCIMRPQVYYEGYSWKNLSDHGSDQVLKYGDDDDDDEDIDQDEKTMRRMTITS